MKSDTSIDVEEPDESVSESPYEQLMKRIDSCSSPFDFVIVYDSFEYQSCLSRIRVAVGKSGIEEWAQAWAIRMRNPSPEELQLNQDRKVALRLVYALCDKWIDPTNSSVTEATIDEIFMAHRLVNILQLALPMDRAQALYAMKYPGDPKYGMHWVSKQYVHRHPGVHELLESCGGFPTTNRRLVMLIESETLGLSEIEVFRRWIEPKFRED